MYYYSVLLVYFCLYSKITSRLLSDNCNGILQLQCVKLFYTYFKIREIGGETQALNSAKVSTFDAIQRLFEAIVKCYQTIFDV